MTLAPAIEALRRHPGMYVWPETFECVVSFLSGYDAAQSGGFLVGFREWLIVRADEGNNLAWPSLVLTVIGDLGEERESAKLIDGLFDLFDEFFAIRQSGDGLRKIYAQYEDWLRHQEWYPSEFPSGSPAQ